MDARSAPLLLPAFALGVGTVLSGYISHLSIPLLVSLLLVALPLRGRARIFVVWLALGLLRAALSPEHPDPPDGLRLAAPVEAIVRPVEHWRAGEDGWRARSEVLRLRQGPRVAVSRFEIHLSVPGAEPPPPLGSTLRLKGYLRRSPGFANAPAAPPGPWRLSVESRRLLSVEGPPPWLADLSARWRRRVERAIEAATEEGIEGASGRGAAVARALVLGDPSALGPDVRRGLAANGLAHLLALSGLHVGLLAAVVLALSAPLPRTLRWLLVLPAAAAYLLVAGPRPALLRASLMVTALVLSRLAQRPPSATNALSLAVLALVLHRPAVVLDWGFQLTVAATAGILLLSPRLAERWGRPGGPLPVRVAQALAVTVAAQAATLPFVLPQTAGICPLAPLWNLLAVPWAALALVASAAWTLLALVGPAVAAFLLPWLDVVAAPVGWPARLPPGPWSFCPASASIPEMVGCAAVLVLLLLYAGRRLAVASLVLAGMLAVAAGARPPGPPELLLLDVGQGDAILLRHGRRAVLVDGGGLPGDFDLAARVLVPALARQGVRRLDAVVMTHPDRDHCRGLVGLLGLLPVAEVWMGHGWGDDGCAGELAAAAGDRLVRLEAGDRRSLGGWRFDVLYPRRHEPLARDDNDRSLVLAAWSHGHRVLLTGDVSALVEARLAARHGEALRSDVLKVAHHGSRSSTGERFLAAVSPRWALVSAGAANPYGHPAPEVVERLERRRVRVLSTHRHGLVRMVFPPEGSPRAETPYAPRPQPVHSRPGGD